MADVIVNKYVNYIGIYYLLLNAQSRIDRRIRCRPWELVNSNLKQMRMNDDSTVYSKFRQGIKETRKPNIKLSSNKSS